MITFNNVLSVYLDFLAVIGLIVFIKAAQLFWVMSFNFIANDDSNRCSSFFKKNLLNP